MNPFSDELAYGLVAPLPEKGLEWVECVNRGVVGKCDAHGLDIFLVHSEAEGLVFV